MALCVACHITCLTCNGGTSTTCLTCNSTNKRTTLASDNSCPCDAGFYDNGLAMCAPC